MIKNKFIKSLKYRVDIYDKMNFITETIDILYKCTKLTVYKIASK